eukprot:1834295-Pyramimonas_sp.AAC.1
MFCDRTERKSGRRGWKSKETRENYITQLRSRKVTVETKQRISMKMKGERKSEETRERMSQAAKARPRFQTKTQTINIKLRKSNCERDEHLGMMA